MHNHDTATFLHELAHAIHVRCSGRQGAGTSGLKPGQDPHQETVAELTACTLAAIYNLDYTSNAWQYISAYNSDPLKAIIAATTDARAAIETLLVAYLDIARGQRETTREIRQLKELYAQLLQATRSSPSGPTPP